jgi:hypothetical protein
VYSVATREGVDGRFVEGDVGIKDVGDDEGGKTEFSGMDSECEFDEVSGLGWLGGELIIANNLK